MVLDGFRPQGADFQVEITRFECEVNAREILTYQLQIPPAPLTFLLTSAPSPLPTDPHAPARPRGPHVRRPHAEPPRPTAGAVPGRLRGRHARLGQAQGGRRRRRADRGGAVPVHLGRPVGRRRLPANADAGHPAAVRGGVRGLRGHEEPVRRGGQPGGAEAPVQAVPRPGEADLHRPAVQHRPGLHLPGRLHGHTGELPRPDPAGGRRRQPVAEQPGHERPLPLRLAEHDVPAAVPRPPAAPRRRRHLRQHRRPRGPPPADAHERSVRGRELRGDNSLAEEGFALK